MTLKDKQKIEWDDRFKGWLCKYVKKNLWKVGDYIDFEDLIQDGYILFIKLQKKYPDAEIKQFMALFKRSFSNYIYDLRKSNLREHDCLSLLINESIIDNTINNLSISYGEKEESDYLLELDKTLFQAPKDFITIITALLNGTYSKKNKKFMSKLRIRESTNEFLCRIVNKNPKNNNIVKEIQQYFNII